MARLPLCCSALALLSACAIPRTVDRLHDTCPPPEFGRPGWVRFLAASGAWIGGIVGGAISVVVLPVTYPISLLAGDAFSEGGREEFLLFPAVGLATAGHFMLGAPADVIDHVLYRAWFVDPLPESSYDLVPMQPPQTPTPPDPAPASR